MNMKYSHSIDHQAHLRFLQNDSALYKYSLNIIIIIIIIINVYRKIHITYAKTLWIF